jgi:hypothetical protein
LITSRWNSYASPGVILQMFVLVAATSFATADSGNLLVSLYSGDYEIVQCLDGQRIETEETPLVNHLVTGYIL